MDLDFDSFFDSKPSRGRGLDRSSSAADTAGGINLILDILEIDSSPITSDRLDSLRARYPQPPSLEDILNKAGENGVSIENQEKFRAAYESLLSIISEVSMTPEAEVSVAATQVEVKLPSELANLPALKQLQALKRELEYTVDFKYLVHPSHLFGANGDFSAPPDIAITDTKGIEAYQAILNEIRTRSESTIEFARSKNYPLKDGEPSIANYLIILSREVETAYRAKIKEIWVSELKKEGIDFVDPSGQYRPYLKLIRHLKLKFQNEEDVEYMVNELASFFPSILVEQTVDEANAILDFIHFANEAQPADLLQQLIEKEMAKVIGGSEPLRQWAQGNPDSIEVKLVLAVKALYLAVIRPKGSSNGDLIPTLSALLSLIQETLGQTLTSDLVVSPELDAFLKRLGFKIQFKVHPGGLGLGAIDTYVPQVLKDDIEGVAVITLRDKIDELVKDQSLFTLDKAEKLSQQMREVRQARILQDKYASLVLESQGHLLVKPLDWLAYFSQIPAQGAFPAHTVTDIAIRHKVVIQELDQILNLIPNLDPEIKESLEQVKKELLNAAFKELIYLRLGSTLASDKNSYLSTKDLVSGADLEVEEKRKFAHLLSESFPISAETAPIILTAFPWFKVFIESYADSDGLQSQVSEVEQRVKSLDPIGRFQTADGEVQIGFIAGLESTFKGLSDEFAKLDSGTFIYKAISDEIANLDKGFINGLNLAEVSSTLTEVNSKLDPIKKLIDLPVMGPWLTVVFGLRNRQETLATNAKRLKNILDYWEDIKQKIPGLNDQLTGEDVAKLTIENLNRRISALLGSKYTAEFNTPAPRIFNLLPDLIALKGNENLVPSFSWLMGFGDDSAPGKLDEKQNKTWSASAWIDLDLRDSSHVAQLDAAYQKLNEYILWLDSPLIAKYLPDGIADKIRQQLLKKMRVFFDDAFRRAREITADPLFPMQNIKSREESTNAQNVRLIRYLNFPPTVIEMIKLTYPEWDGLSVLTENNKLDELEAFRSKLTPIEADLYKKFALNLIPTREVKRLMGDKNISPLDKLIGINKYLRLVPAWQPRNPARGITEMVNYVSELAEYVEALHIKFNANTALIPDDIETNCSLLRNLLQDDDFAIDLVKYFYQAQLSEVFSESTNLSPEQEIILRLKEGKINFAELNRLASSNASFVFIKKKPGESVGTKFTLDIEDFIRSLPQGLIKLFNSSSFPQKIRFNTGIAQDDLFTFPTPTPPAATPTEEAEPLPFDDEASPDLGGDPEPLDEEGDASEPAAAPNPEPVAPPLPFDDGINLETTADLNLNLDIGLGNARQEEESERPNLVREWLIKRGIQEELMMKMLISLAFEPNINLTGLRFTSNGEEVEIASLRTQEESEYESDMKKLRNLIVRKSTDEVNKSLGSSKNLVMNQISFPDWLADDLKDLVANLAILFVASIEEKQAAQDYLDSLKKKFNATYLTPTSIPTVNSYGPGSPNQTDPNVQIPNLVPTVIPTIIPQQPDSQWPKIQDLTRDSEEVDWSLVSTPSPQIEFPAVNPDTYLFPPIQPLEQNEVESITTEAGGIPEPVVSEVIMNLRNLLNAPGVANSQDVLDILNQLQDQIPSEVSLMDIMPPLIGLIHNKFTTASRELGDLNEELRPFLGKQTDTLTALISACLTKAK